MLVVIDGVVRFYGKDEIGRDDLCALVKKLIKGVLSVCGWFTEKNWTGGVFDKVVC